MWPWQPGFAHFVTSSTGGGIRESQVDINHGYDGPVSPLNFVTSSNGRQEFAVAEARADQGIPDEVSANAASEPFPTGDPLPRHARPVVALKSRRS